MNQATRERLFGLTHALAHPVTLWITLGVAAVLLLVPVVILALDRGGRLGEKMRAELWARFLTWLVLIPAMLVPVLLGAAWTVGAVTVLVFAPKPHKPPAAKPEKPREVEEQTAGAAS